MTPRHPTTWRPLPKLALFAVAALVSGCRYRVEPTKKTVDEGSIERVLEQVDASIGALDVQHARDLLDPIPLRRYDVDRRRARLAVMVGDCQGAVALLSAYQAHDGRSTMSASSAAPSANGPTLPSTESPEPIQVNSELHAVAEGCARAMAGAAIAVDATRNVWVRFQNDRDRVLLPLIAEVADRAATAIGKDLGTVLPRPLRIELVADLASLSAVTGLPLEAAETTGTIAIARWGKVTLVSPRATPEGFPWQDTLAHELAHLVITRQSADAAPLWLQEGLAKREETRWRSAMPLDATDDAHREALRALLEGRSIGIDRLGASIALLPTPAAAETAYAEVRDFVDYWIGQNGETALALLLRDLATIGSDASDRALVSVTGYDLGQWIRRWQRALLDAPRDKSTQQAQTLLVPNKTEDPAQTDGASWTVDVARRLRLAELLEAERHYRAVIEQLEPLIQSKSLLPEVAQHYAYAWLMLGQPAAATPFLEPERIAHLDGTWLAIRGRALAEKGEIEAAEIAFRQALAFAPTLDKVACRGFSSKQPLTDLPRFVADRAEPWASLCQSALSTERQ